MIGERLTLEVLNTKNKKKKIIKNKEENGGDRIRLRN